MAKRSQFEGFEAFEDHPATCAVGAAMLPEAIDGTLSAAGQIAFEKHLAGCTECARELAEARRGAAWLSMLKSQAPEPPVGLLARILADTTETAQRERRDARGEKSGTAQQGDLPVAARVEMPVTTLPPADTQPRALHPNAALPSRPRHSFWPSIRKLWQRAFPLDGTVASTLLQPRLAMTMAMAFFSIALTLNLTGVRLRDLRAANFTPSAVKRMASDMDASVTRMFQNNRSVYQVESRLSELRRDDAMNDASPAGHQ